LEVSNGILEIALNEIGSAYLVENLCRVNVEVFTLLDLALNVGDDSQLLEVLGALYTII
jgi:hypothetical protein